MLYVLDMTLGKRIKAARTRCKKTQREVAEHFGISTQAVSEWERDEGTPEFDKLKELPRLLQTTADYLLNGEGPAPDPGEMQGIFEALEGPNRRQALRLLRSLAADADEVA